MLALCQRVGEVVVIYSQTGVERKEKGETVYVCGRGNYSGVFFTGLKYTSHNLKIHTKILNLVYVC